MSTQRTEDAIIKMWQFKTDQMRRMLVAVLRIALEGGEFSALDLAQHGAEEHGGTGICGAVFKQLKDDGILEVVGVWSGGAFYPKTITNDGGNPIKIYRLANAALARTLLHRHEATATAPRQASLDLRPSEVFA